MGVPSESARPPGPSFAERVRAALRVRCVRLQTKEAFLGLPGEGREEGRYDTTIWWCAATCGVFGPDGGTATPATCEAPGRRCYQPPVRPGPVV